MVDAERRNLGSAALLLFAGLAVAGCGTTTAYRPKPEDTRDLTPVEARRLLKTAGQWVAGCSVPLPIKATYESFGYCGGKGVRYADHPELIAEAYRGDPIAGRAADATCIYPPSSNKTWNYSHCLFFAGTNDIASARDFVRAWTVLARDGAAFRRAQDSEFELAAKTFREAAVKPELPEAAVRFKVQAEAAVREKRFGDADALYEEALGIAPWWPAGHYNRGLILGELKDYEGSIDELKRYLKVDPDASNARVVQLKIYEWEGLAPKAAN